MIIGICGKSGSGKSTLSKTLTNHYKNIIHLDIDKVGHNVLTIKDVKNELIKRLDEIQGLKQKALVYKEKSKYVKVKMKNYVKEKSHGKC